MKTVALLVTSVMTFVTGALTQYSLTEPHVRFAAFNVQVFGQAKINDPVVKARLVSIFSRYDIVLLQEIRDSIETAVPALLAAITSGTNEPWAFNASARLGRTTSKEQYAFIFRSGAVEVLQSYQYPDLNDVFEREPYGVLVKALRTEIGQFAVMGIHTSPSAAEIEVDALVDVYDAMAASLGTQDIIIAGDFNADCTYIRASEWPNIRLFTDTRFSWLIGNEADTTVTSTGCAYDRIVIRRGKLENAVIPGSAVVYKFDEDLGLTQQEAQDVSDHYPVECEIMGKILLDASKLQTSMSVTVTSDLQVSDPVALMDTLTASATPNGFVPANFTDLYGDVVVMATENRLYNVLSTLETFNTNNGGLLSNTVLATVKAYVDADIWQNAPYIAGLENLASRSIYIIRIVFHVTDAKVHVTVEKRVV